MDKKPSIYFAHPHSTFGTPLELSVLRQLGKLSGATIINPGDTRHQQLARCDSKYFERLVASADELVYLPFADGKIDASIPGEAAIMFKKNAFVSELQVDGQGNIMCSRVKELDKTRILGREETLARNAAASQLG